MQICAFNWWPDAEGDGMAQKKICKDRSRGFSVFITKMYVCISIQPKNKPVPMQIAGEAAAVGDASVDPR